MGNDVKTFRLAAAIGKNTRLLKGWGGRGILQSQTFSDIFLFECNWEKEKRKKRRPEK